MSYTTKHWSIVLQIVDLGETNYVSKANPSKINCQGLLFVFDFPGR